MKLNPRRTVMLAVVLGALQMTVNGIAAPSSAEVEEATAMMDPQQRQAAAAREKDPAWRPSCKQVGVIQIGDKNKGGALKNFCLNAEGNILACYSPKIGKVGDAKNAPGIRVYSPKGALLKTLPLEIKPTAVCMGKDGSIFVAGEGKLLKLDAEGKVLASAVSPVANEPVTINKEMDEMIKQSATRSRKSFEDEKKNMMAMLERRRSDVTGLSATSEDVFMAVPAPGDFTFRIYRLSQTLQEPKLVVEKLRGCCGQMDVQSHDGKLWIPHNARHLVESRDRDGKELTKFGKTGKVKATDFGGCCEPKNLRVLSNGDILAAESGPPTCIKRFSANGEFKGVVAVLNSKGDCVRVTVEVSPDGAEYYMLDTEHDAIRIFRAQS